MKGKKRKPVPRDNFLQSILLGLAGGIGFYVALCLRLGGFMGDMYVPLILAALGMVGGLFPELLEAIFGKSLFLFRSWTMVIILLFAIPIFIYTAYTSHWYFVSFIYGYMLSLIWSARESGLSDI